MPENQLSLSEKQVSSYATGERQKSAHIKNSLFLIQTKLSYIHLQKSYEWKTHTLGATARTGYTITES